jgi:protease I
MYPKVRLEEEGCTVVVVGAHPAGQKYTGKFGYPIKSTCSIADFDPASADALVLPGGFAPDYMRRNEHMLRAVVQMLGDGKPVAAICHGPWMLCSARGADGHPVARGRRCTAFEAIKDDVVNAGATWCDDSCVVDGNLITAQTPSDLTAFCHAIIDGMCGGVGGGVGGGGVGAGGGGGGGGLRTPVEEAAEGKAEAAPSRVAKAGVSQFFHSNHMNNGVALDHRSDPYE